MQIHELNNFAGPLNANVFLPLDNGSDTGKIAFNQLFKENSYTILWQGAANTKNTTITLSEGISGFDFIDFYYGYSNAGNYQVEYKRVPISAFSEIIRLDMLYDIAYDSSFLNIYHYVTSITKTSNTVLTISDTKTWEWAGDHSADATKTNTAANLVIYRIDGIRAPGNTDGLVLNKTVTVDKDDWNGSTQTVTVSDVTANSSVLVCPIPSDQTSALGFGVYCSGQGAGTLTFTCVTTPTVDIDFNVMIVG